MEQAKELLLTFAVVLAVTTIANLIGRRYGKKGEWALAIGIAIGVTLGRAIQMQWMLTGLTASIVIGVSAGFSVWMAQIVTSRSKTNC